MEDDSVLIMEHAKGLDNSERFTLSGADHELYQRNVSEFQGVWYYDGDLSATTCIVIDGYGNWSDYQLAR